MSLLNSTSISRLILLCAGCALAASAQTKKILVMGGEDIVKELQAAAPQARIVPVTRANVMQEIGDADGFVGDILPGEVRAGKKLKWVQSMSAGVENVLFLSGGNDLRDSDIVLTNNKIVQGPEIADHAFALLLSLTRRLPRYMAEMHDESLDRRPFDGIELRGKTAVVIGVGGIGMQIAQRAWAFGMTVIGVDPEDKPFSPFVASVVKPDQIDTVIPKADVVFISAPHTERSHKEMGSHEFELMKDHAYFIAVSRGGVYDMNGLVKGLDSRRIAGAGVDVTDPEPLPKGHPLWKFDNVIITPHIAGRSDKDHDRMVGTVKENLERFVDGKPLVNVVDKQKGY
jgi:phosphoglycerate dehydrogenase-like enzyme